MDPITSILLMEYETCVTRWEVATLAGVARDRGGIAHSFVMATRRYAQPTDSLRIYIRGCGYPTSNKVEDWSEHRPPLRPDPLTCLQCLAVMLPPPHRKRGSP